MADIHALIKLACGDHSHNYLIAPATDRKLWHAKNFTDIVVLTLKTYRAGVTPSSLAEEMTAFAEDRGFADFMVPGFEHGIGMLGDDWRIGRHDGPFAYWTDPNHVYRAGEVLICAIQYACLGEGIGFKLRKPDPHSKGRLRMDEQISAYGGCDRVKVFVFKGHWELTRGGNFCFQAFSPLLFLETKGFDRSFFFGIKNVYFIFFSR